MIIKAIDANKYARNRVAADELFKTFALIGSAMRSGHMSCMRSVIRFAEPEIAQLAEWLREKGYDLSRDDGWLIIDWSKK